MTGGSAPYGSSPPPPAIGSGPVVVGQGPPPRERWNDWWLAALLAAVMAGTIGLLFLLTLWNPFGGDSAEPGASTTDVAAQTEDGGQAPAGPTGDDAPEGSADSLRCPVMTDSIDRLFLAFFERTANEAEFSRWVNRYRAGEDSLATIAQRLADSADFDNRYDLPDDRAFVERIYINALGGLGEAEDIDAWVRALDSGLPRGSMVVAVTESQQAVEFSRTATPMAGFLRQYPLGTHWYCGTGPRDDLPIKPLTEATVYADYMFHNGGDSVSRAGFKTVVGTTTHLELASGTLPVGVTNYRWNGLFEGDGNYGTALDVEAGPDTWWVMVFYPESIGEGRLGWQIGS